MSYNIAITAEMRLQARDAETKTLANLKKLGKKQYTGVEAKDEFYTGYLGEIILLEYFKQNGVQGDYHRRTDGIAGGSDFHIFTKLGRMSVDVKTAGQPFHRFMLIPEKQWQKYRSDFYIGVRLDGDTGEVHGWCMYTDFEYSEKGVPPRYVPSRIILLSSLKDMRNIVSARAPRPTQDSVIPATTA